MHRGRAPHPPGLLPRTREIRDLAGAAYSHSIVAGGFDETS
jgi:hypothetical protein